MGSARKSEMNARRLAWSVRDVAAVEISALTLLGCGFQVPVAESWQEGKARKQDVGGAGALVWWHGGREGLSR